MWRALADHQVAALSGDSAGGHLALTTALRMRDSAGPMPAALVLISPAVALGADRREHPDLVRRDILLSPEWEDSCLSALFSGGEVPAEANLLNADLHALPRTLVVAGTDEMLCLDAEALSAQARQAGVTVENFWGDGLWHDYPMQAGVITEADAAITRIAAFIGR